MGGVERLLQVTVDAGEQGALVQHRRWRCPLWQCPLQCLALAADDLGQRMQQAVHHGGCLACVQLGKRVPNSEQMGGEDARDPLSAISRSARLNARVWAAKFCKRSPAAGYKSNSGRRLSRQISKPWSARN
jgi:hypothetical protein